MRRGEAKGGEGRAGEARASVGPPLVAVLRFLLGPPLGLAIWLAWLADLASYQRMLLLGCHAGHTWEAGSRARGAELGGGAAGRGSGAAAGACSKREITM